VIEIKSDNILRYQFIELNCLDKEDLDSFQKNILEEKIPAGQSLYIYE